MSAIENDLSVKQYFLSCIVPSQLFIVENIPKMFVGDVHGWLLSMHRAVPDCTTQFCLMSQVSIGDDSLFC